MSLLLNNLITYAKAALTRAQRAAGADAVIGVKTSTGEIVGPAGTPVTLTMAGPLTADSFKPVGNTVPTNGMYLSATNILGFSTNTLERLTMQAGLMTSSMPLRITGSVSGYGQFTTSGSTGGAKMIGNAASGSAFADVDGLTALTSDAFQFRVFRSTNSTGSSTALIVYSPNTSTEVFKVQPAVGTYVVGTPLILAKTSGIGIKVDTSTPTFPWRDIIGQIVPRGAPAVDPSFNVFRSNVRAYQFSVNDEIYLVFHIPHDYVPGTDLHIHCHWAHASATVTSGSATWSFESIYAKGHNQAAFAASKTTTVAQAASTTQYQHMIAETPLTSAGGSASLIDNALIEPDGIVMVRVLLSANTLNGTPEPYMFTCDLHYQSTNIGTKQKAPSFYT